MIPFRVEMCCSKAWKHNLRWDDCLASKIQSKRSFLHWGLGGSFVGPQHAQKFLSPHPFVFIYCLVVLTQTTLYPLCSATCWSRQHLLSMWELLLGHARWPFLRLLSRKLSYKVVQSLTLDDNSRMIFDVELSQFK
jgi:hypothetical protein